MARAISNQISNLFATTILIRGAGEIASGIAHHLHYSGFHNLLLTEVPKPLAIRRHVSFSEAVYEKTWTVEGTTAESIYDISERFSLWDHGKVAVIVDPENTSRIKIHPTILIDATLRKRNIDTNIGDASLVIGIGPGFIAGIHAHFIVETERGHNLGRLIYSGSAAPDTGIPGEIQLETLRRVLKSPGDGRFEANAAVGDVIKAGQVLGMVDKRHVFAEIPGILRGILRNETHVTKGCKLADIDPRNKLEFCYSISDKCRTIAGATLAGILHWVFRSS